MAAQWQRYWSGPLLEDSLSQRGADLANAEDRSKAQFENSLLDCVKEMLSPR